MHTKKRLVLEDGAMHGPFTAGVLAVLMEPLDISRVCHDPARMQRIYDIGCAAGEAYVVRGSCQSRRRMR